MAKKEHQVLENYFPGCKVTISPNGKNEIWIQDERGHGFRITAGAGPAGLRVTAGRFVGGNPISIAGNEHGDEEPFAGPDMSEVSMCQYNLDERSQAFKRWYHDPENNPHPDKMEGLFEAFSRASCCVCGEDVEKGEMAHHTMREGFYHERCKEDFDNGVRHADE